MNEAIEYQRFREVREELKMTQSEFAEKLAIKNSTADIERGKTRITGSVVMELLNQFNVNPLWLYGKSDKKYLNPHRAETAPSTVGVNSTGNENILLVNQKAAAGYGLNLQDPDYFKALPAFDFPLPEYRNASFRGFQINGDSMTPLVRSGDWVLAKAVNNFNEVRSGKIYIVVESESIRLKEVVKKERSLTLISLNPEYPPVEVVNENILEMWEYHSKISFGVDKIQGLTLQKIYEEVKSLRAAINP